MRAGSNRRDRRRERLRRSRGLELQLARSWRRMRGFNSLPGTDQILRSRRAISRQQSGEVIGPIHIQRNARKFQYHHFAALSASIFQMGEKTVIAKAGGEQIWRAPENRVGAASIGRWNQYRPAIGRCVENSF